MTNKLDRLQRTRKNFDIRETSQEQKNGDVLTGTGLVAEKAAHICYEPQLAPEQEQRKQHFGRRYRIGGTTHINLPQVINFKSAVDFAASVGTPLVAHCIIHWVGTDAGDDPTGELFAQVREALSLWLRRRCVPFAAVWAREKLSGGQAEVEHGFPFAQRLAQRRKARQREWWRRRRCGVAAVGGGSMSNCERLRWST
jgi:hypothetical protein